MTKSDQLKTDVKILRERENQGKLDTGEAVFRFKREKEANSKLQADYEKLDLECRGLRGFDSKY